MKNLLTQNLGWKLLSLLIALALWLAVAREPEVATSISVPVEFRNMSNNLDITGALPDHVRLELRGPSGRLTRDNLSGVAVVLDLSGAEPGERTYTIRESNLILPSGVEFYRAVPSQLSLHFDELETREATVQPVFINTPAGYRITDEQFSPAKVTIRGAEDRVKDINKIRTDPMNLTDVVGVKVFHTHLNIGDPQVRLLNAPIDVTVRVTLQKTGGSSPTTANGGGR